MSMGTVSLQTKLAYALAHTRSDVCINVFADLSSFPFDVVIR